MYAINVSTPLKPDTFVLESMSVFESLSRIPTYQITLLSKNTAINPDDLLAQPIVVTAKLDGRAERVFYAYVTEFSSSPSDSSLSWSRYHVTAHPWLWFLGQNSDCRVFQNNLVSLIRQSLAAAQAAQSFQLRVLPL